MKIALAHFGVAVSYSRVGSILSWPKELLRSDEATIRARAFPGDRTTFRQPNLIKLVRFGGVPFTFDETLHVSLFAGLHSDCGALPASDPLLANHTDRLLALGLLPHAKTSALGLDSNRRGERTAGGWLCL